MFRRRHSGTPHAVTAVAATILALVPGVASAEALPAPERDEVMLWTAIVTVLVLAAAAVGFAYRQMSGMDHPTPDEIELMGGHGHGNSHHSDIPGEAAAHDEVGQAPVPTHQ